MLNTRLRSLRENKHLTQKDASEIFDISRERYNQYETGKRKPDYDILMSFAKYFNVSTDYLLGYSNKKTATESEQLPVIFHTKNEEKLLTIFNKLKKESLQEKALIKFEGYVDGLSEIEDNTEAMGNDALSTHSKKDVG